MEQLLRAKKALLDILFTTSRLHDVSRVDIKMTSLESVSIKAGCWEDVKCSTFKACVVSWKFTCNLGDAMNIRSILENHSFTAVRGSFSGSDTLPRQTRSYDVL